MRREKRNKKVVVALSGGVDSAVAAALLKKAGFTVIGIFLKFWSESNQNGLIGTANRCCSPEAESRARKVAKILKIPFYVFDLRKEFKKRIVDEFLNNYKKGITPNPCVVCNKEIKFGLLLKKALVLDADFLATGHYALKREINSRSLAKLNQARNNSVFSEHQKSKIYQLLRAKDKDKDQSYFLWMLNQAQLSRILLPIGDYTRAEVEKLAKKFKLPVLRAKKSVEICFIQTSINDFLKKYLKEKPGKIIDTTGRVLGKHQGLWFYTIGQRKGIGLPGGPYFVLDKDIKRNFLIVTKNEKDLFKKELVCQKVNWLSGIEPSLPLQVMAKIRYRQQLASATIYKLKNKTYKLIFNKAQRAITPGQSVVFYQKQNLLGGGIIIK